MIISEEERNRIRCSVALSVPLVLQFVANPASIRNQEIQHMVPTYVLKGIKGVAPYFTPWTLKDTGKKRVYVNANGYRIRYITRKMLNCFESSIRSFTRPAEDYLSQYANRWVVMKGEIKNELDEWDVFTNQVVLIEANTEKENHPPLGPGKFVSPLGNFDLMNRLSLEKYTLETVHV